MLIDHVNISAPKPLLQEVRTFYCDVLGFTEGYRPKFSKSGYWLYSQNRPLIHLTESDTHHRNDKPGFFDHFALQATGVVEVLDKLNAREIEHTKHHLPEIGLTQIFCKDPSGTGVELNFLNEPL